MADRAPLILASASPRRLALLRQVGVEPAQVVAPAVNETPIPGELPRALALRLAQAKTLAMAAQNPGALVLAADTVVACGRRILGKPADEIEARAHLERLSGRRHRVYGGIALARQDGTLSTRVTDTVVRFKRLSAPEIRAYLDSGEWEGKAGGYAIQGRAGAFVAALNGSPSNVVGLCVHAALSMLQGARWQPGFS